MSKYFKFVKNEDESPTSDCRKCDFEGYGYDFCNKIGCGMNALQNNMFYKYAVKITKSEAACLIKSGCKIIYRGKE